MASVCNLKRSRVDDCSQDNRQTKRHKSAPGHRAAIFPPSFWDDLSKVWLTTRALRELDRRNKHRPATPEASGRFATKDLARFARQGGPDLRRLRGFLEPNGPVVMDSTPSTSSRGGRTPLTKATTPGTRGGKSSAYSNNFHQHLIDHNVYPVWYRYADDFPDAEPRNLDKIQDELLAERASLSPSQFPQSTFQDFKQSSYEVTLETDVMATVLPVICGSSDIPNKQNVLFTELNPITTHKAVKPKPDFFDGARLQDLGPELRNDQIVRSTVIPTKHHNVPVAPNFFLEAKSPSGGAGVVQRQACYDGAYGARALHALQNYGETEPTYDGNAYAYSSTYHSGTLRLYAHHVTEPSTGEGRPEYHMTQAGAYGLDHNRQAFMDGVKAFRNARDMAKQHRDIFIQAANAKAAQAATMDPADVTGAREEVPASREMLESAGGLDSLVWQYTDDALQAQIADISNCPPQDDAGTADPQIADISNCPPQDDAEKADPQIADISNCPPQDDAGTAAMTRHLGIGMEGDSQIPSQEPAVLDCSTALGTNQRPPKRPRQSVSPPNSKRTQSSMSGTSPSTGPRTVQSAAPTQSGSSESH